MISSIKTSSFLNYFEIINTEVLNIKKQENNENFKSNFFEILFFLKNNFEKITKDNCYDIILMLINESLSLNEMIPFGYFEPLINIIDNPSNQIKELIIETYHLIYHILSIRTPVSSYYFNFFSQPMLLEIYFQSPQSYYLIQILNILIKKKENLFWSYREEISKLIEKCDLSEALLEFLYNCFKIDHSFIDIYKVLDIMLLELFNNNFKLYTASIDFFRKIIMIMPELSILFVKLSSTFIPDNVDDIKKLALIHFFEVLVKNIKSFDFLINQNFINLIQGIFVNAHSNKNVISALINLLNCNPNISPFVSFLENNQNNQLVSSIVNCLSDINYKDQKRLLKFIIKLITYGNENLFKYIMDSGFSSYISLYLETTNDKTILMELLSIVDLMKKEDIEIDPDVIINIEKLTYNQNNELSLYSLLVLENIVN